MNLNPVTVTGHRPLTPSSYQEVVDNDFLNFPRQTPSDLMRFVPGIHLTQHTGGAKAHQFFLRGFDAEHGMDLAAFLDGIPLNETSHIHGQGYLDLHFIIPETISRMQILKGPYDPDYGNFANAGAVNFVPHQSPPGSAITATAGNFGTYRVFGEYTPPSDTIPMYLALEASHTNGFTDPGELTAFRGFSSIFLQLPGHTRLRMMSAHYDCDSNATDVVPLDWVESGLVDRFGGIDTSDGVESRRHLVGITLTRGDEPSKLLLQGFYNYKHTVIFSNYTYYLFHADRGDQYEMNDERSYGGSAISYQHLLNISGTHLVSKYSFQTRVDWINQLYANTEEQIRFNTIHKYDFREASLGAVLKERWQLFSWLELIGGVRYDLVRYDGKGTQDVRTLDIYTNLPTTLDDQPRSLHATADIISPKFSAILTPRENIDIFLNYGESFCTDEARKLANFPVGKIPKVRGAEIGSRFFTLSRLLTLGGSLWWADKEKEFVFDPGSALSSERGKSRRLGAEMELRFRPLSWLYLATDLYYINSRFLEDNSRIPYVPTWLMTNSFSLRHPSGIRGSLRGRFLGPRHLSEGIEADAYYVADLLAGYERNRWGMEIAVDNLFNGEWEDSTFYYNSRPEPNGEEIWGVHYTPGTPLAVRFSLTAKF